MAAPIWRWRYSFRHVGLIDEELSPRLRELATARILDRAPLLGATMRVGYMISAAMPGVLPRTPMKVERGTVGAELRGVQGRSPASGCLSA